MEISIFCFVKSAQCMWLGMVRRVDIMSYYRGIMKKRWDIVD